MVQVTWVFFHDFSLHERKFGTIKYSIATHYCFHVVLIFTQKILILFPARAPCQRFIRNETLIWVCDGVSTNFLLKFELPLIETKIFTVYKTVANLSLRSMIYYSSFIEIVDYIKIW